MPKHYNSGVRKARAAANRAKLLLAAGQCFARDGYEATGVRDIAREAGVSTGAFFNNWPSKDEAYREIYGHRPVSPELGRALLLEATANPAGERSTTLQRLLREARLA